MNMAGTELQGIGMRLNRFIFSSVFLFLFCPSLSCQPQAQISTSIKKDIISNRVVVFSCLDVNTSAIASREGIIVIDTHRSPGIMLEIRQLIEKEFGRSDFLYVINTHGHSDHCSGNQIFPTSTIIGHENCPECMRHNPANTPFNLWRMHNHLSELEAKLDSLDSNSDEAMELRSEISIRKIMLGSLEKEYTVDPPSKIFSDSLTLSLGDLTLKLIYCGKAHTDNDIFVYVPEEELVFTGDMFSRTGFGFPVNKMADVPRVISALNQIQPPGSEIKFAIPGHGDPIPGHVMKSLQNQLKQKYDTFEGKKSAAQFLEETTEKCGVESASRKCKGLKSPSDSGYYFSEDEFNILGDRLLGRGRIEESIGVLKTTADLFPHSALAYDYLGQAYMKKGDIESAVRNYEMSLRIFPENENAKDMLKFLRNGYRTK
jgi:glyoxylase-like metal-dependent hydrolase (beta-lactamase superfamily II)